MQKKSKDFYGTIMYKKKNTVTIVHVPKEKIILWDV